MEPTVAPELTEEQKKILAEHQAKLARFDNLNKCKVCGKSAGKYIDPKTGIKVGVFLFNAVGGGKICNLCVLIGQEEREIKKKG